MERKTDLWLVMIIFIYTIIGFFNLGDYVAPQKFWKVNKAREQVILDIGELKHISRMMHYCGLVTGDYDLYTSRDGVSWENPMTITQESVFSWDNLNIDKDARYVKIIGNLEGSELGEIGLYNVEELLVIKEIRNESGTIEPALHGLIDEPYAVPIKSSYKNSTYFDEVYHARTAYEHLHHIVPYEWTHPPLGKIIISIGIKLFGMTPFGWRFMGTVAGIIMIPLMYGFGKLIFGEAKYGLLAALLIACDGMHFTQTRIATVDSFLVLFILFAYFYMYKYCKTPDYLSLSRKLILLGVSGLWIGLAIATKWTGLYGGLGLAIVFFWNLYQRRKLNKHTGVILLCCTVFFVLVPIIIYVTSYIPYFIAENSQMNNMVDFINMQKQMYNYHSKLEATHAFGSPWWSWPILYRPVWFYMGESIPVGRISTIVLMGNPLIWWSGTLALLFGLYRFITEREKEVIFLMIGVLSAYVPYIGVNRIMFLYHFFPVLPFMILFIIYAMREIEKQERNKSYIYIYVILVIGLFVGFYPVYTGLEIPKTYGILLRWFPSWHFFN